jgi:hypothetical protein
MKRKEGVKIRHAEDAPVTLTRRCEDHGRMGNANAELIYPRGKETQNSKLKGEENGAPKRKRNAEPPGLSIRGRTN